MNPDDQTTDDPVPIPTAATRNPWDDDHPDATTPDDPDDALTMRLLRPSLIALAVCTIVIFISAVVSNSATASSPLERVSLAIHRLGMFGLLLSFIGILVSYRLPAIVRFTQDKSWRNGDQGLNRGGRRSGMRLLLVANFALIVVIWLVTLSGIPLLLALLRIGSFFSVGVLLGIVLVKRGILQAYAVGVLVALLLVWFNSLMLATHLSPPYRFNSFQYRWMLASFFALHLTVALVIGLVCATIYMIRVRAKIWK